MHPDVRKLIEVQKVDQKIAKVRRDLDGIPAERARRQADLDRRRATADAKRAELQEAEVEQRALEMSLKQADGEIEKLQARLNTVKNNAEYQATLLQIESVKSERNKLEERGLETLEAIETVKTELGAMDEKLAAEQKVFDEFVVEAEKLLAERRIEYEKVSAGRDESLADLPVDLRNSYERLFGARDGQAVVPVEGENCMGCYTSVQPNLLVKLQAGSAVVQCDACKRILYMPGT